MVVQHNIEAINANGQLGKTTGSLQLSAEKLSSGYRINRAADDAAGLKISEKMRSQVRGLKRARSNAEDGISLIQTADGALEEVHSMLQRMNELCVQAANDTNTEVDRDAIQEEINALVSEVDRIAETATYNNISLLDGSLSKPGRSETNSAIWTQVIDAVKKSLEGPTYTALNGDMAGQVLSQEEVDNTSGIKIVYIQDEMATQQTPTGNATNSNSQYNNLKSVLKNEIVPNAVKAIISAYGSSAFNAIAGDSIGIGLYLGDNSTIDPNVLAYVELGYSYYTDNSVVTDTLTYKLGVNLSHLSFDSNNNLTDASRNELEVTVVHEMMHMVLFL